MSPRVLKTDFMQAEDEHGFIVVSLPKDAEILRIGEQSSAFGEGLKIWFLTEMQDGEQDFKDFRFAALPTGPEAKELDGLAYKYITTLETSTGIIVHIFQILE